MKNWKIQNSVSICIYKGVLELIKRIDEGEGMECVEMG
jgi:hypothetical protein